MDATLPPVFKPDEPRKIQTKSKDAAIEAMEDVIFGSVGVFLFWKVLFLKTNGFRYLVLQENTLNTPSTQ